MVTTVYHVQKIYGKFKMHSVAFIKDHTIISKKNK